jgi:hypothetical protein
MMRSSVATVLVIIWAGSAALAQEPQVTFELESDIAIVGQPLRLRIEVLVPTWMPKPAVFPTIEVPSLLVRLPERGAGPISGRIDGETWSGVQRSYRLYPLAAGEFELPAGDIVVTYADPDTTEPVEFRTPLPDIRFAAGVPSAAVGLDPPIIAQGFTLEQSIDGETALEAGDAITRTITARIDGTTPVLIPALTPEMAGTALRGYGKEPVVSETEDGGVLSGSRVETTTYVGQQDGSATLPGLTLDWFNLATGKIETVTLPETTVSVTGTAVSANPPSPREIARWVGAGLLAALGLWLAWRYVRPPLVQALADARARYEASERAAYQRLARALKARDLSGSLAAAELWARFYPDTPDAAAPVQQALTGIGAARFGNERSNNANSAWLEAERAAHTTRSALRRRSAASSLQDLPPLNP